MRRWSDETIIKVFWIYADILFVCPEYYPRDDACSEDNVWIRG